MQSEAYEGIQAGNYLQVIGYSFTGNDYGSDYPEVEAGCELFNPSDAETDAPVGTGGDYAYTHCYTGALAVGGWTEDSYHTVFFDPDYEDGGWYDPDGVIDNADCNVAWSSGYETTTYNYYGTGQDNAGLQVNGVCLGQTTADIDIALVSIAVTPETTVLESGETVTLSAQVSNTADYDATVTFQILNGGAGSLVNSGNNTATYTAPDSITSATTVKVQACTNITTPSTCTTSSTNASISLTPLTIASVSASPTVLLANGSSQSDLYATLGNTGNGGTGVSLTWTASPGSVSNDSDSLAAVYTAPASATFTNANTVAATVTAQISQSSPAIQNSTTVTLVQPVTLPTALSTNLVAGSTTAISVTGTGFSSLSGATSASITSPAWGTATIQSISVASNTMMTLNIYVPPNPTNTAAQPLTMSVTSGYGGITTTASTSVNVTPLVYTYTITATPASANLMYGGTQAFTPTITCKLANGTSCVVPQTATYSLASGIGSLSAISGANTIFTDTYQGANAGIAVITMCATVSASTCSNATVTEQATSVLLSPNSASLTVGKAQVITASISGSGTANTLRWSVSPTAGSLSYSTTSTVVNGNSATSSNTYTAPSPISSATSVTITACMLPDGTACGSVVYTLQPVTVSVSPSSVALHASQTQQFTATVANGASTNATWSLTGTKHGSLSSAGLYTAPAAISGVITDTVQACSVSDPTKCATATVTLSPWMTTTTISLSSTTITVGQTATVNVAVGATGESNPPTGTVTLYLKGTGAANSLGSTSLTSGIATFQENTTGLAAGPYTVYVVYGGDSANSGSTSASTAVTVLNNTNITLAASSYSIVAGSSDTLTASITPTTAGGKVTFGATGPGGTYTLGTATLSGGTATLTSSSAGYPLGYYTITASYPGDSLDAAATSHPITVGVGSATTTSFTFSPTTVTPGQTITGTCTVTKTSGTPTGTCAVLVNGSTFISGPLANGTYEVSLSSTGFTAGNYSIQAVYSGDSTSAASSSSTQTLTVQ